MESNNKLGGAEYANFVVAFRKGQCIYLHDSGEKRRRAGA